MEKLLKTKLEAVVELKNFTNTIMELNLKTQYAMVDAMLEERQKLLENISEIEAKIKAERNSGNFVETNVTRELTREIRQVLADIYKIDNILRKNINEELKIVREKINHPETTSKSVNLKA